MIPSKHRNCNGVLNAAPEDRKDVVDLHVCRTTQQFHATDDTTYAAPVTQSFWKPTPEELVCLIEGGMVALSVVGYSCPPVYVGAIPE